jgi:hypothetical protein
MTRNARLAALIALVLGLSSAACEENAATAANAAVHDLAVYSEMSPSGLKKVAPGWNTRMFNRVDVAPPPGSSISIDMKTGYITLKRGTYHITASSNVTYNDLKTDPLAPGWITHERPNGGYARLRDANLKPNPETNRVDNEDSIIVGTISNANMVPSLIDTYFTVTADSITVLLEHQVGDVVDTIYLQDNTAGPFTSEWHVFARIAIRKL